MNSELQKKEYCINYKDWIKTVPEEITNDRLWKLEAYRLGLFAADLGWYDETILMKDKRTLSLSGQLYRSLGSISTNIAEGYSRGTGKDRARFYEYALGSARETRDWYYKSREILGIELVNHRVRFITQIIRLLLTMIPQQRSYSIKEPDCKYKNSFKELLKNIPLP